MASGTSLLRGGLVLLMLGLCLAGSGTKSPALLAADELRAGLQDHIAGRLDEAAAHYRECTKYPRANKICLYNLGLVAQTQNRAPEAENYYRLSLVQDPNYAPAVFNLAIVRTNLGAIDDAIQLYRHYITLQPDDAGGHLNLGILLSQVGQTVAGDAEIARAMQLNPSISRPPAPAATDGAAS